MNLDGYPASSSTVARKHSALYSAFAYAVELGLLAANPMGRVRTGRSRHSDVVDRRVVVNPDQAAHRLAAVRTIHPSLEAYVACLYYAGLRPAEARHLREKHLRLPERGWGSLLLVGSTPPPTPVAHGPTLENRTRIASSNTGPRTRRGSSRQRRSLSRPFDATSVSFLQGQVPSVATTSGTPPCRSGSMQAFQRPRAPSGRATASTFSCVFTPSASTGRRRQPWFASRPR